jgi:hypothetical protein
MRFWKSDRVTADRRRRTRASKLQVDLLEGRMLLSTLTVMNSKDSGPGSLRQAIISANSGDKIIFARALHGSTINLAGSDLYINKSLDIEGPGSASLTISAGGKSRVFEVTGDQSNVTIAGMTVRDGKAVVGGGITDNAASLTLKDVQLLNNQAVADTYGGAMGGGLYARDSNVTIDGSLVTSNEAIGANVHSRLPAPGGIAAGGGIEVVGGSLDVSDTFFQNNVAQGGAGQAPKSYGGKGTNGGDAIGGGLDYHPDQTGQEHVTITDSEFEYNQAIGGAAGLLARGGNATGGGLTFHAEAASNMSAFLSSDGFYFNTAQGGQGSGGHGGDATGGGLYLGADMTTNASIWLMKMDVSQNNAIGGVSGANYVSAGHAGNASGGGMVFDAGTSVNADFNLYNSSLTFNLARGGAGTNALSGDGGAGGDAEAGGLMNEANHASQPIFTLVTSKFADNDAVGGMGGDGASASGGNVLAFLHKGNGGNGGVGRAGGVSDNGQYAIDPSFVVDFCTIYSNTAGGGWGGKGGNLTAIPDFAGNGGNGGQGIVGGLYSEATNTLGAHFTYTADTFQFNQGLGGFGGDGGDGGITGVGGNGGNSGQGAGGGLGFLGGYVNNVIFTVQQSTVSNNNASGSFGGKGGHGVFGGGNGGRGGNAVGAGVDIFGGSAGYSNELILDGVTIAANEAKAGDGGMGGQADNPDAFGGNGGNAGSSHGAGLSDSYWADLNVQHSSITGNNATAGALGARGMGTDGRWGNDGLAGYSIGGGVYLVMPPGLAFRTADTTIAGNSAQYDPDVHGHFVVI